MALRSVENYTQEQGELDEVKISNPEVYDYFQQAIIDYNPKGNRHWIEVIMMESRLTQRDKDQLIKQII